MVELVVRIERSADEPVYEQVARQVRSLIAAGELKPGTILPPVRTMASDLGVNLNTVARAYRLLEEEGFVRIRDRTGAEVVAPAPAVPADARARLAGEFHALVSRMRQAGIPPGELRRLLEGELAVFGGLGQTER